MDISPNTVKKWAMAIPIISSAMSLLAMGVGGLLILSKMQEASARIPDITTITNNHALEIAVLQEQQKGLERKYGEIMLQLSRLDAKLDKQNEYLFNSLERISRSQKGSN
jgi:hypothetical protein